MNSRVGIVIAFYIQENVREVAEAVGQLRIHPAKRGAQGKV